jgi:hypothetical protein
MGHTTAVALVLALAVGWAGVLYAQVEPGVPAAARGTSSITGRVIDPNTNTPVRGAQVVAATGIARLTTVTDEAGSYRLDRLAAGDWQVTASKGGYISWQYGQRRPFQLPPPIALGRGQEFTADIPLTRGGAISGRISDEFGGPLAGLHVRTYRTRMERGVRRLEPVAAADFTDDTGSFRVYGLPPGDYYVAASLRLAPVGSVVETTYSPTYYPGTGELAEAQRIRLGLGTEATAVFPLLPVRRVRVSGLVLSSSGAPGDAFLNLESESSEFGVPLGIGGVTRSDGTFTLADVAPGRYRLTATLRGDGPDESGSVPLTVYGDDVSGTTLVTGGPATLRGRFVVDAGVTRRLPEGVEVVATSARAGGTVLGSGEGTSFEIDSLSEPFRLSVEGLPEGWAVKEITVEGFDALEGPVTLAPGQEAAARVVLTDRITEVVGTVEAGGSADGYPVVVFPEDSAKWSPRSPFVRRVRTDAQGAFMIQGLPAGQRYLAVATDYLDEGEHQDPEFLAAVQSSAVAFSLDEGERRVVDVRLVER